MLGLILGIIIVLIIIVTLIWYYVYLSKMILFYRNTCPACVSFKPTWNAFRQEAGWFKYRFVEIDTEDVANQPLVTLYNVTGVPTIWLVDWKGTKTEVIKANLASYLN